MTCYKYTRKEDYKVKVNIQTPISTSSLYYEKINVGMNQALYNYLHLCILPCLCTFWQAIPTANFILWIIICVCGLFVIAGINGTTKP